MGLITLKKYKKVIYTTHASSSFYQNYLPKLAMSNTADVIRDRPNAATVYLRCKAINPLVAFYDIHERKREVLSFYFVPGTT
jgi:hypothetical protein